MGLDLGTLAGVATIDTAPFDRGLAHIASAMRASARTNEAQAQASGAAIGRKMSNATQAELRAGSRRLGFTGQLMGKAVADGFDLGEASKSVAVFAGKGVLALAGLGLAGAAAGVKTAAGLETARIGFTTMLGSAKAADTFLKQLADFAAKTPFEFPELQTAASSLISAGIAAQDVIPIMTHLGDVTQGMGTGSEGIKRATVALQQMNAAGKITAEDLNQLRDAGIPVYDLLAAATHRSKAEVAGLAAAGKLGRRELDQLMEGLKSGAGLERFNGLMAKTSTSLTGLASTFKDTFTMGLAKAVQPSIPLLKQGLGGAIKAVGDAMPAVSQGFLAVSTILSHLAPAAAGVGGILLHVVLPAVAGVAKILGGTFLGSTEGATAAIIGLSVAIGASKFSGALEAVSGRLIRVATDVDTLGARATRTRAMVGNLGLGLGKVAGVLGGPWGIAIALGVSALISFATKQHEADKAARDFTKTLTFQNGVLDENSRATLAKQLADEGTLAASLKAGVSEKAYTDALVNGGQARVDMIKHLEEIASLHTTVTQGTDLESVSIDAQGKAAEKAAANLRAMGSGLDAQAVAAGQAANATGEATTATTAAGDAATVAAVDVQKLINKFTILRGGAISAAQAEIDWQDSLDSAKISVKSNRAALDGLVASGKLSKAEADRMSRSLNVNTESGRNNRRAILGMVTELNNKVTQDYKAGKSSKALNKEVKDGEAKIRAAAHAAHLNKGEVDKLIGSTIDLKKKYKELPKKVSTKIDFDTSVDAINTRLKYEGGRGAKLIGLKSGGVLPGYTPGRDVHTFTSPTAGFDLGLSGGEAFMRPEVTKAVGEDRINQINAAARAGGVSGVRKVLGFDAGGILGLVDKYSINSVVKEGQRNIARDLKRLSGGIGLKGSLHVPHPAEHTRFRGGTFTRLFAAAMRLAEKDAHRNFRVMQGGFRPTSSFSGSTHNKDAVDFRVDYALLRAFRRHVGAAGDRTGLGNWAPHVHAVPAPGRGYGSPSAQAQYRDYVRRGGPRQSPRSPWGLATGTDSAAAGFHWTGEKGAELVVNPQIRRYNGGETVLNREQTAATLAGGNGRGPVIGEVHNHFPTADPRVASAVAERVTAKLGSVRIGG